MLVEPPEKMPWYLKPLFWLQKKRYGQELVPAKIWARSPSLFLGVSLLWGALDRKGSPLDKKLRTIVSLYLSQINRCRFCVDLHQTKLESDKIAKALPDYIASPLFSEREKIAISFADKINGDKKITPDFKKKLKENFSNDEIVELTGLVSFQILSNKFNGALDVPSQNLRFTKN